MEDEPSASAIFTPPSISCHHQDLISGHSYAHYSPLPALIAANNNTTTPPSPGTACVLGVDEAGRGPVIGPMLYSAFYLPLELQTSLLATTHHFDDSKVLTPAVRANLMRLVCTPDTDLHQSCGWAVKSLSARDISAGMLRNGGAYNLNAQAMDATVELIRGIIERGVNVREIYIDTIGAPVVYQKKLERIFPTLRIVVEKKADSLYPCVSAASVMAKVTRDVSCEVLYSEYARLMKIEEGSEPGWGSGYPSDARCVGWLKRAMDPVFGWGGECRFSWGTAKDMLEAKDQGVRTDWSVPEDEESRQLSHYFGVDGRDGPKTQAEELRTWFGTGVGEEVF